MKTRTARINVVIDVTVDDLELTEEEFEAMDENEIIAYCLEYDIIQEIIDGWRSNTACNCYVTKIDEDNDEED